VVLSACVSISTMQPADTVEKDILSVAIFGGPQVMQPHGLKTGYDTDEQAEPALALLTRYGFSDRVDAGLKIFNSGFEMGAKYQPLQGDLDLALATDLGLTYYEGYAALTVLLGIPVSTIVDIILAPKVRYGAPLEKENPGLEGLYAGGSLGILVLVDEITGVRAGPEVAALTPLHPTTADRVILQGGMVFMLEIGRDP
jgi:hypothetical protein